MAVEDSTEKGLSVGSETPQVPTISRRKFLGLAAGTGLAIVAAERAGFFRKIANFFEKAKYSLTEDQVKALEIFQNATNDQKIFNARVIGLQEKYGKTVPINIRNSPHFRVGDPEKAEGVEIGKLKEGTIINEAVVVWAKGDPDRPYDEERYSRWYAFPDPKDPNKIVFAWSGGITTGNVDEFFAVAPFDLKTGQQSRQAPAAQAPSTQ